MVPEHGPTWVGHTEVDELAGLVVAPAYRHARLLVTAAGDALGEITVGLRHGVADAVSRAEAVRLQIGPTPPPRTLPDSVEPITVVVPTRGRPTGALRAVRSVLAGDHPAVTVLVVDLAPTDDHTRVAVEQLGDPRVYYLRESRRTVAAGRNRGLVAATTALVAFTDDATEVDPAWTRRMAGALADPDVAAVTGPVLAARLAARAERTADLARPRPPFRPHEHSLSDTGLLPLVRTLLAAGSSLAVRAEVARGLGGFDEALAPGGVDAELVVRLMLAGHVVAHEPSAWVRRRPGLEGTTPEGLPAVVTKVLLSRAGRGAVLCAGALRGPAADLPAAALLSGPLRYLWARTRARRSGGRVPPMRSGGSRTHNGVAGTPLPQRAAPLRSPM